MAPSFYLPGERRDTPIDLSDDEGKTLNRPFKTVIREKLDTPRDVIDLTAPSESTGKKRRFDSQHGDSLSASSTRGTLSSRARKTPNQSVQRDFAIPRVNYVFEDLDDHEFDFARELNESEVQDFRRAQAFSHALPRGSQLLKSAIAPLGFEITPNMNVKLFQKSKGDIERFFRIKYIIRNANGDISLRGILMKRSVDIYFHRTQDTGEPLHTILPNTTNDLCMQLQGDEVESSLDDKGLAVIHITEVETVRKIVFTNQHFTDISYMNEGLSKTIHGRRKVQEEGLLACRWKYVEEVKGRYGVPSLVASLSKVECDKGMGVPDEVRIRGYGARSATKKSGLEDDMIDLTIDPTRPKKRRQEAAHHQGNNTTQPTSISVQEASDATRRNFSSISSSLPRPQQSSRTTSTRGYTHGEICAGLGGTLRGAVKAGLNPSWALDKWDVAVESLLLNWPRMRGRIMEMSIQDFVIKIQLDANYAVDVIHISFPCQGHSWLNRGQNPEQDAKNNETITTLTEILKHLRPRIVTLEQTDGILTKNEGYWFRKVVSQLTCAGYSVRCKVFNMAEYGLCQARKRLIVVAACPGQKLPKWPAPTHGDVPGLRPRVTLGQAVSNIPDYATAHDVNYHKQRIHRNLPTADMNVALKQLVDTGGAKCLLPDTNGSSYWPTWREQMRMQGFPDEHRIFGNTQDHFTTQIGNAVPPLFAKPLFEEIIKALKESDRKLKEWNREIVID